ncbi:ABC transporter permease [Pseudomonas sp. NPDC089752]|uniref:ABC transporter permease n=1 Tax=Pseudomonas sp. NPDC089752 TaxID=3364472 RepID=UPI0037F831E0
MKPWHLWGIRSALLTALLGFWLVASANEQLRFFIGDPMQVAQRLWSWLSAGGGSLLVELPGAQPFTLQFPGPLYPHLLVTLAETLAALAIGVATGLLAGLWLGLNPTSADILAPFIKAANAVPRVVLAPLFILWYGLGMTSKIALGISLVFFTVFFNVMQGVREVSPALLCNLRLMGANRWQLIRLLYLPSATGWVFSSLNAVTGLAFVGVVVGEYLGSTRGIGYLILQAEATFDVNTVVAGIMVLMICALCLDGFFGWFERRAQAWRRADL